MFTMKRIAVAVLLGALGCLFIWVAAPYNNFYLNNSFISDTYFPEVAVVFLLLLVLVLNPLLRCLRSKWILNDRQLALIFAMLLGAAVIPGQGLLRMLPWSLARTTQDISRSARLAEAVQESGVPGILFPDAIRYEAPVPVSEQFLLELDPGASIPWGAWIRVLLVWGPFLLACWLLMVGVGLVLFPEWKERERLQFPLLGVYRSLFPEPTSGSILPRIFRDRVFWIGAGIVLLIYALNGLNHHTGNAFPGFPLGWQLGHVFSEDPWRHLPGPIKNVGHIHFVLVGMAFFMPNRVGFSLWFTIVAYGIYEMVRTAYFPGAYRGATGDHRNGSMLMIALMVLYLSRHHWVRVGQLMVRRVASDADRLLKVAGWMLTAGALGMFIWLRWAGVPQGWAVVFVLIGFMVSLLVARIVAETGLPFVRITGLEPSYFLAMAPAGWVTGAAIYMAGFVNIVFSLGSRVSAAVMVSHAVGVDENASPRHQLRIGYMMIAILLVGLVIGGIVHLHMGYSFTTSIDGASTPLCQWGSDRLTGSQNQLLRWTEGFWPRSTNRLAHLGVGMGIAGALQIACMMLPRWPLHPVGMLLVGHHFGNIAWASVLLGWSIKALCIHYGGATLFRRLRPLFLGIILGEIFSAVIWTIVPIALILLGHDPTQVGRIPILPR